MNINRFGRQNFEEASKVARKTETIDWDKFKYMVFDIPNHHGTYKDRYSLLGSIFHISFLLITKNNNRNKIRQRRLSFS